MMSGSDSRRRRHATTATGPRWPRRILVAVNVVVAVLLLSSGLVYGYVRYRINAIHTLPAPHLVTGDGTSHVQDSAGLAPENILLIGNETRLGQTEVNFGNPALLTGSLSDVIMLVHLDPRTRSASILSIPRDLFAPMPAGSPVGPFQKIDAALNDGANGADNLVTAIEQDFGIPINHFVEVEFDGFLATVNALGGLRLDFPERLYDAYSGLDITHTGCQLISGREALALVRARHLQYDPPGVSATDRAAWPYDPESALARIVRDHTFVQVLVRTAEDRGLSNPIAANAFLSALTNQIAMDKGLRSQLVPLVVHYGHIDSAGIGGRTLPVTAVNGPNMAGYQFDGYNVGEVEFPDQPADNNLIRSWDPGAFPTPVAPSAVRVYNDVGSPDLATTTAAALRADGLHVSVVANGTIPGDPSVTFVQYHPGQLAEALAVMDKLSGAVMLQAVASVPAGVIDLQAGTTFSVDPPHRSAAPAPTQVPTPNGEAPSSSANTLTPYDPRPCTGGG
jgi:LCP family protein required for cell wall assembly